MSRLFMIAGRINHMLFLLIALGAAVMLSYAALQRALGPRPALQAPLAPGANTSVPLLMGNATKVIGTDALMVTLDTPRGNSGMPSPPGSDQTRNVLFVTGPEKKARWLMPHHQSMVLEVYQIQKVPSSTVDPVLALMVRYAPAERNGDGALTYRDADHIALASTDGTAFTPLLQGVDRVLVRRLAEDGRVSLVYLRGTSVRHASMTLAPFKLDSDTEIAGPASR